MSLKDMFKQGTKTGRIDADSQPNKPKKDKASNSTYSQYKLNAAKLDVKQAKEKITKMEARKEQLLEQKDRAKKNLEEAKAELGKYDKVQKLLQLTSDYARQKAKGRMEDIVTQALNVVFGGNHEFRLELDVRANRPVVDYYLDDGDGEVQLQKPDYDVGGGKVDVISLALRLAVAELVDVKGPLLLDEIGKHVSDEYAPNVAYFLKQYSTNFNRQIILITHNQDLAEIGEVSLEVEQTNGESEVKSIC